MEKNSVTLSQYLKSNCLKIIINKKFDKNNEEII